MSRYLRRYFLILFLVVCAGIVSFPQEVVIPYDFAGRSGQIVLERPASIQVFGRPIQTVWNLKQGLDIQGGTQVVLNADMSQISEEDRPTALESAREVIARRVDLYGVSEPNIQTSRSGDQYRLLVELAGINQPDEALRLVGTTAQLEFLLYEESPEATSSAESFFNSFRPTDITGADLQRSSVQFDQQTGRPQVGLEFNGEGTRKFASVTQENTGKVLGIFLDGYPLMLPRIDTPILDGKAVITGEFSVDEAKNLSIQLNAGALPIPIQVVEQRSIGASLGQESVQRSVVAGLIGLFLVIVFMIFVYGWSGVIAAMALVIYSLLTIAIYKLLGVTLTLPGIAGLLLTIGMAVDANILIFERMKEELRAGTTFEVAMNLGFGKAWDSIKDANIATIFVALILINPLNLAFLNTSGLVRGFGITLLTGVLMSLFTGVVVSRTLMRLFLKEKKGGLPITS